MCLEKQKTGRGFSSDIVRYLRTTRSLTLKQIGGLIGQGESFVSLVGKGKRSFTFDHLFALEVAIDKPMPLLVLEASEKAVSENMKRQYDLLREILGESGKLRAHPSSKAKRRRKKS